MKRHEKKKWRKVQKIPHWKAKRYAKLYREYSEKGTLYGKVPNALVLKKVRFVKNRAGKYPRAEEKLEAEFAERRRVGDPVSGMWLQARMKQIVIEMAETEEEKKRASTFKASERWLRSFAKRWGLSYRKKTNRKSRSSIRRSLAVRKFHWFAIYKARLYPSKRSEEWKKMVDEGHQLTK